MLDSKVKKPIVRDGYDNGFITLHVPHNIEIAPASHCEIDFAVAVKFPPGLGGTVKLRPHLHANYPSMRVMESLFGKLLQLENSFSSCIEFFVV
jgi:hypothetical protein